MKKALVLGAGGFIGSHLVKRLKKDGYWIRGVDLKHPEFSKTEADHFVVGDLRNQEFVKDQKVYAAALFFGFIHGLGFSNMLRSLLGGEADILQPLLFFNLGLEVGQLFIVLFSLVAITSLNEYAHIPKFYLVRGIALFVGLVSIYLVLQRVGALF